MLRQVMYELEVYRMFGVRFQTRLTRFGETCTVVNPWPMLHRHRMLESLKPGITHEFRYLVPDDRTVPHLLPESDEFSRMPRVLATGYMVGLIEWACIQAINPHLDWPREQTVGTAIDVSHVAATPPGMEVSIAVRLTRVDVISTGTHERFVIEADKFNKRLAAKAKA
jgi:fluoroacetyl-CoA thioesterase